MKILYASKRPPFPFFQGGAARSAHYLLSTLNNSFNATCKAIGDREFQDKDWPAPSPEDYCTLRIKSVDEADGLTQINSAYPAKIFNNFSQEIHQFVRDYSPDIIWTQLDGADFVAKIGVEHGIKTILFLRDAEDTPYKLKPIASSGVCIVCNSQFMANRIKAITGREAPVIYPSLEKSFGVTGSPEGYITMINPTPVKGIDTFLEIARLMPQEKFLLVESWTLNDSALNKLKAQLENLPNVRFSHRVPDVATIFSQTKLLLAPSKWEEAFGRVVIEAQSCRIPVIASSRGGLPESLGKGGICIKDYLSPSAWVTAIHSILNSPEEYARLATLAYEHANSEQFTTTYAAQNFMAICARQSNFEPSLLHKAQAAIKHLVKKPSHNVRK